MDSLFVDTNRYVYFDEKTGEILSVGSKKESQTNYIKTPINNVIDLLTGKESIINYCVTFDISIKKYVLSKRIKKEDIIFDINDTFFCIPSKKTKNVDVHILQNNNKKQWILSLSEDVISSLKNQSLYADKTLFFAVCKNNDPHQLSQLITVKISELLEGGKTIDFSQSMSNDIEYFIYTIKKFETYNHEVSYE